MKKNGRPEGLDVYSLQVCKVLVRLQYSSDAVLMFNRVCKNKHG